jgi:hypothetical protein
LVLAELLRQEALNEARARPKQIEISGEPIEMDILTAFGLFAVSAMLLCYALEDYSHWLVLAFAGSCALGSTYGFLQGAWPFGVVEAIWSVVALRRWYRLLGANRAPIRP